MTLFDRLKIATAILAAAFIVGGIIFFVSRGIILAFVKRFEGGAVSKYWLVGVLGYPVAVVYGFAIYPIAGFILLLPLIVMLLIPELFMVNRKTEPSVNLPDRVELTSPLKKVGGKFETRLTVNGEDWSAEFSDDGLVLPSQGHLVRIVERQGLKLIIAREEQQ